MSDTDPTSTDPTLPPLPAPPDLEVIPPKPTPKVKPGWQTTEFWLSLLLYLLTVAVNANLFPNTPTVVKTASIICSALKFMGYTYTRWDAKKAALASGLLLALFFTACTSSNQALRNTYTGYVALRSGWNEFSKEQEILINARNATKQAANAALDKLYLEEKPAEDAVETVEDLILAATYGKAAPGDALAALADAATKIAKVKADLSTPATQPGGTP